MRGSTSMTLAVFHEKLPNLIARGFPPPDPDTGNFDLHAIDRWCDFPPCALIRWPPHASTGCRLRRRWPDCGNARGPFMTRIKLRYYVIKRGKGFWQPTPKIKAHGFASVPCGVDGPDAWKIVEIWNNRWDAARRGDVPSPAMAAATNLSPDQAEELSIYPSRSLGEAFRRYRRTDEWQRKAPRTREDWWRAWRRDQAYLRRL